MSTVSPGTRETPAGGPPVAAWRPAAAPASVEVIADDRRLGELAEEWESLLPATPEWSGFQSHAWIAACRSALPVDAALHVLRFRAGGRTIALFPTERTADGVLRFIGGTVTNYRGPLHLPERLPDVARAFRAFLADAHDLSLVDFDGLRARCPATAALASLDVPGWTPARAVRVADCPSVDLSGGWRAVFGRRRSRFRSGIARKWAALRRLGPVECAELTTPDEVRAIVPSLFELFRGRWSGRHESGGFADRYRLFHEIAMPALAAAGHVRVSILRLDGAPVAFAYGVRGARGTTSYVLGHANALAHHSPGQLLLVRALETACARGDVEYDLSIGDEAYKRIWATATDPLLRIVRARHGAGPRLRAGARIAGARAWVAMRSVGWLRDLRRDGLARLAPSDVRRHRLPDAPGLRAGRPGRWRVHELAPTPADASVSVATWGWAEMRRMLSPRLLAHAAERSFRGDRLLALSRAGILLGIVWRARDGRRAVVAGGHDVGDARVYYHPVAVDPGRAGELTTALRTTAGHDPFLLVTTRPLRGDGVSLRHVFRAGHELQRP